MTNKILQKPLLSLAALLALGGGAGIAAIASAQTVANDSTTTTQSATTSRSDMHRGPGVFGTIASVNGNTITVTSKGWGQNTTETTYTVDVSNAKVMIGSEGSAPSTGSVSSLKVGDTVAVRGTVSGTNVVATDVMDGVMPHGFGGPGGHGKGPGVMGTVSAVNGNTVTVTNTDGTSYTVDATSAEVSKISTVSVSDIKVGDTVGVMGTVSGTSVTATHIMDGMPPKPQSPPTTTE